MRYRCNHCRKTVSRASRKRWLTSFCATTGRMVRLWLVKKSDA